MRTEREIAVEMWGEEGFASYGRLLSAARDFAAKTRCPLGVRLLLYASEQANLLEDACLAEARAE